MDKMASPQETYYVCWICTEMSLWVFLDEVETWFLLAITPLLFFFIIANPKENQHMFTIHFQMISSEVTLAGELIF